MAGPTLTTLQQEGVSRARVSLARYGGVIVADSVGMGKTHIGVHLVADAVGDGAGSLVVVPAMLRRKWRDALRAAGLEVAWPHTSGAGAGPVILTTHTGLHRGAPPPDGHGAPLVLIDEAHQFRNPRTARYRALARLTANARVAMLTATPINNRPEDLYWLLRLFLGDGGLRRAGVPDLRAALLDPHADHAALVRRITGEVVFRRTRRDWSASARPAREQVRFPARHPPRAVRYELDTTHVEWIHATLGWLRELRLTSFDVGALARKAGGPAGTSALILLGLLKRLESSAVAFRASVLRLLSFLEAFTDAVRCGCYVRPADVRAHDPLQLALTTLVARPLPRSADASRLARDAAFDIEVLRTCIQCMPRDLGSPKTRALADLLGTLDGECIVIFTEFTETAEALFQSLPQAGTALLHGTRCALASGTASRRSVLERFAPVAPNAAATAAHDVVQTLIATDVLAEGVDLQAARHCVSYDLPWNPVRLMQRAGRIDRLGSPHADVYVWYFVPMAAVERMLGLLRRLAFKTTTIERMVGAEHGVVPTGFENTEPDAESSDPDRPWHHHLLELLQGCGRNASDASRTDEPCAPAALIRVQANRLPILERYRRTDPQAPSSPLVSDERISPPVIVIMAWERGGARWVEASVGSRGSSLPLESDDVARLLCDTHADLGTPTDMSEQTAQRLRDALRQVHGRPAGPPPAEALPGDAAAAVRAALLRDPSALDAALCRRSERILRRLRSGLSAGRASALERLLRQRHELDARALICRMAQIVGSGRPTSGRKLVGLLAIVVAEPPPSGDA